MKSIKNISDCRILVVGDIMLDKYIVGDVDRISPEAPVPVVNVFNEFSTLGGCGNVISNLRELGAKVTCISKVGVDLFGAEIINKLNDLGVEDFMVREPNKITTVKERVVANHRMTQLVRIDREDVTPLDSKLIEYDFEYEITMEPTQDIIIISDYNKGVITKDLVSILKKTGIPIVADPKLQNVPLYNDVMMITPNKKEYKEIVDNNIELNNDYILKTLGRHGMEIIDTEKGSSFDIKSSQVDVYNVSGAGDTVVAVISLCLAMGIDLIKSAKIANESARYVVQQPGTSVVPKEVFNEILKCN